MIEHALRTLPVVLSALARRDGARISRLRRRVRLRDLDYNVHMNQAVYAQVVELGRTDLVLRSGAWAAFRAQKINPVVAEQRLVYRRELRPGMRYTIDTRAVAIEGRLLVFESWLVRGAVAHTLGEAKMIFIGPDGVLGADEVQVLCEGFIVPRLSVVDWKVVA